MVKTEASPSPEDGSPIEVALRDGAPRLIHWSGRTYYVECVLQTWVTGDPPSAPHPGRHRRSLAAMLAPLWSASARSRRNGKGTQVSSPPRREYYRLKAGEEELEIYRSGRRWYLSGVLDHREGGEVWREREGGSYRHRRLF